VIIECLEGVIESSVEFLEKCDYLYRGGYRVFIEGVIECL